MTKTQKILRSIDNAPREFKISKLDARYKGGALHSAIRRMMEKGIIKANGNGNYVKLMDNVTKSYKDLRYKSNSEQKTELRSPAPAPAQTSTNSRKQVYDTVRIIPYCEGTHMIILAKRTFLAHEVALVPVQKK